MKPFGILPDRSRRPLTTSYNGCHNILQGSLARFCSVSLPNQNEFNRQNKINGHYCFCVLHRIIIKQSHVILSQIFDTARNAYCILSDQCTDNLVVFFYGSESLFRPESSDFKKEAVCRILRFWLIMKIE